MQTPSDDEVAAALAAVRCLIEDEAVEELAAAPVRSVWQGAARLLPQTIAPARLPAPSWGNVERLRRAARAERE